MSIGTLAPSTITTVNLTGQTEFNIPFDYLARKFVLVTLLGNDRKVLVLNTDYRFVTKTRISLANPTPAGYTKLELRRNTSASERLVDYHDGSILRAYELNLSQLQSLHVAEEARDSVTADSLGIDDNFNLDARGKRIVNLAAGIDRTDAVSVGQLEDYDTSSLNSAIKARSEADRAEREADRAEREADRAEREANRAALEAGVVTAAIPFMQMPIPPSLPTLGRSNKMVMKPSNLTDAYALIVTRKAQGKRGYVAMAVVNACATPDASNYGGESNYRMGYVLNGSNFFVGKTGVIAKSAGVKLSTFNAAQIDRIWGFSGNQSYFAATSDLEINWNARQCYCLQENGDNITYQLDKAGARIRVGLTNGASDALLVEYSHDNVNFVEVGTFNTKLPPSGTVYGDDIEVRPVETASPYYLRITNKSTTGDFVYIAGLNIGEMPDSGEFDYDNALLCEFPSVDGAPSYYLGGTGSNEFAAKEAATGKFFGTYHGGHSDFLERLRTDGASYNMRTQQVPALLLTTGVQLHSSSKLSAGGIEMGYSAETFIGDGVHITHYSIRDTSVSGIKCERAYTHMCTTQRNFNWIHIPFAIQKSDDGDVPVGNCMFIQQYRSGDAAQLNTYFSGHNMQHNSYKGAYISFQPNYNKQYYGPAVNAVDFTFRGGNFVTAKEFM